MSLPSTRAASTISPLRPGSDPLHDHKPPHYRIAIHTSTYLQAQAFRRGAHPPRMHDAPVQLQETSW
jgi:hypothetical protein